MRHFRIGNAVYGYDEREEAQCALINDAMAAGAEEIFDWPPSPEAETFAADISVVVQEHLDKGAMAWGYHNMLSAVSYSGSKNKKFKAEAQALLHWRDEVWTFVHEHLEGPMAAEQIENALPLQPDRPK